MRQLLILFIICNCAYAQIYDDEINNQGPAFGRARNFTGVDWTGKSHVLSELGCDNITYSYVYHAENDFRLFRKEKENFVELANLSKTQMGSDSSLLHVYEDSNIINIFSWAYNGYNFISLKKIVGQPSQPVRHVLISNSNHSTLRNDPSVKSITFEGANQMKIIKNPSEQYPETELLFEIRPDGVYRNGIWDKRVGDYEDGYVIEEKLKTDPNYYETLRQAQEARLANDPQHQAELKQAGVVNPIQQPKVSTESTQKPTATPLSVPLTIAPLAEPERTLNFTPWLAGLVALLVILLGYFGLRYFRKSARS